MKIILKWFIKKCAMNDKKIHSGCKLVRRLARYLQINQLVQRPTCLMEDLTKYQINKHSKIIYQN